MVALTSISSCRQAESHSPYRKKWKYLHRDVALFMVLGPYIESHKWSACRRREVFVRILKEEGKEENSMDIRFLFYCSTRSGLNCIM